MYCCYWQIITQSLLCNSVLFWYNLQHTKGTSVRTCPQNIRYIAQSKLNNELPWSQIHGTAQSKPRTFMVIYVDFNEMLIHPADIQHRHTTGDRQSFNTRIHTQLTTIQSHILAQHKLHSIQLHTSSNNHKEHLLW